MSSNHAIFIHNQEEAKKFLAEIDIDPRAFAYMVPKAVFHCIKLKHIQCRAANIIKQEMLSKGGEAAVKKDTLLGQGHTDVLLMGTLKHYRLLIKKLKVQPLGLRELADEIQAILNNLEPARQTMQLANGGTLEFGQKTLVMGILNVTPDSFSDGGKFYDKEIAIKHALEMLEQGADIIDIGGASSRPDSEMADEAEEIRRVLPVVERLAREKTIISIDTFRAGVARACLEKGAHIINDIGRLQLDPDLLGVLVKHQAPVILMHNRMQFRAGEPYNDLVADICEELEESIEQAVKAGLSADKIIIDPGVGFGKTPEENLAIINRLREFRSLGKPVLLGVSRKSFIGKTLGLEVDERLEASLAAAVMGIINGADIVRVHDVTATKRAALITDAALRAEDKIMADGCQENRPLDTGVES